MGKSPIVARINDLLLIKGKRKTEFFSDCGITSAAYSQWNTGKTNPSIQNLKVIADYLGTTYEYLLTGIGQKEKPTLSGEPSDARKQLDAALDDMSDEELLFLMSKIKAIKEMRE